jgi:hypothetical protein
MELCTNVVEEHENGIFYFVFFSRKIEKISIRSFYLMENLVILRFSHKKSEQTKIDFEDIIVKP